METKLPATTINGTTDSASLLFPKAAQALYHRSETLCYLLLLRFRDQAKNRENGLRFPANGISHVIGCILEQPSQILSVTCGRNTFQERRSGLQNLLVASCLAQLGEPNSFRLTRIGQIIQVSRIYGGDVTQRARVRTVRSVLAVMVSLHSAAAVSPHRRNVDHGIA